MLRKPGFWLVLLWLTLVLGYYLTGRLTPLEGEDSSQFKQIAAVTFTEYLAAPQLHVIPIGYPLFLKAVGRVAPDLAPVPLCQLMLHGLAVYLFYRSLGSLLVLPWLAGAVAGTLLFSNTILEYGRWIMSDAPAASLAIATVAALLSLVRNPRRWLPWGGLALAVFATCQVRAAYLFLLPLLPILGVLLLALMQPFADWRRWRLRVGLGLLAACVLPYLLYAGACRLLGGGGAGTAMGAGGLYLIATQFLDEEMIPALPPDVRPLATRVIERQKELDQGRFPQAFLDLYRPYYPNMTNAGVEQRRRIPLVTDGVRFDPKSIYTLHDLKEVLKSAEPEPGAYAPLRDLALRLQEQTVRHTLMHLVLADTWYGETEHAGHTLPLALAILRARPWAYFGYLLEMLLIGLLVAAFNSYVHVLLLAGLLLLLALWHVRYIVRVCRGFPVGSASRAESVPLSSRDLHLLLLLGVSFALSKTLLVILGSIPVPRYMDAAGVFLPGVTLTAMVLFGCQVFTSRRTPE